MLHHVAHPAEGQVIFLTQTWRQQAAAQHWPPARVACWCATLVPVLAGLGKQGNSLNNTDSITMHRTLQPLCCASSARQWRRHGSSGRQHSAGHQHAWLAAAQRWFSCCLAWGSRALRARKAYWLRLSRASARTWTAPWQPSSAMPSAPSSLHIVWAGCCHRRHQDAS